MSDKLPDYFPKPRKNPLNHYTVNLNECTTKGSTVHKEIDFTTCNLVILSPSFGCPGIFEKGKDIVLYVLADFNFFSVQQDENDPNGECLKERVINYHLKINKWSDSQTQKESCGIEDKLLYTKGNAVGNIKCTLLDYLGEREEDIGDGRTRTLPPERRIYSDSVYSKKAKKDKDLVACIRDSTLDYYLCKNQKAHKSEKNSKPPEEPDELKNRPPLPFLYKIELKPDTMQTPPVENELYDVAWFITTAKRSAIEFGELQDLACEYVACDKSRALKPTKLFKVNDGIVDFSQFDDKSPIQAYHPFIVSNKDKLNFGHLSDVHISARQIAFRDSTASVFQNKEGAQPIGKLFNSSLESFGDMLKTLMKDNEIHAIVITGDLVDHAYNFNPTVKYSKPGELWTFMDRQNPDNQKHYQPYIDNLAVLSLFKHCYDTYKKPIFLITGNHDSYKDIFAISPRVGSEKGIVRGNSGLPADHNLTIYEACLMYGPKYHEYFKGNFQAPYVDWFYHLFTPLTDYRFTFKQQSVVGLGWGDDEDIVNTGIFSLDMTLYRASKSVSDQQLELINAASKEGSQRLICSHFPFVSYDVGIGITTQGSVNCNDWFETVDLYSQGTFKENRAEVYQHLHDKKFHYTLSGHSHRSGVYAGDMQTSFGRKNFIVTGKEIPHDATSALSTTQCNMIVSGCSGPVGVQNNYETATEGLGSFGLDYPSGNSINFANNTIKRIIPKEPTAKPRFAVALDYMDIMGRESSLGPLGKAVGSQNSHDLRGNAGVFTSIVSDADGTSFTFTLNKALPKEQFIEGIAIVAYVDGGFKEFKMDEVSLAGAHKLVGSLSKTKAQDVVKGIIQKDLPVSTFLSITFNTVLSGKLGYTQYNYESPWIYAIEILRRKDELKKEMERRGMENYQIKREVAMVSGYVVRRNKEHGEIPNHQWYSDAFGYGYVPEKDRKNKK